MGFRGYLQTGMTQRQLLVDSLFRQQPPLTYQKLTFVFRIYRLKWSIMVFTDWMTQRPLSVDSLFRHSLLLTYWKWTFVFRIYRLKWSIMVFTDWDDPASAFGRCDQIFKLNLKFKKKSVQALGNFKFNLKIVRFLFSSQLGVCQSVHWDYVQYINMKYVRWTF